MAEPQEALQPEEADFWGNGITELTQSPYEIEPGAEQLAAELHEVRTADRCGIRSRDRAGIRTGGRGGIRSRRGGCRV